METREEEVKKKVNDKNKKKKISNTDTIESSLLPEQDIAVNGRITFPALEVLHGFADFD